jgi:transposase
MGRRVWIVREIVEILRFWQAGNSHRAISDRLGIARNTVRKYVREAIAAGATQETIWSLDQWATFVRQHFPEVIDPQARSERFSLLDPYREHIAEGLKTNRVSTVYQRIVEGQIDVSLSSFYRYVRLTFPDAITAKQVVVWRPEVEPGQEAQVDFGYLGTIPAMGKKLRIWAFILVLSFSRHMFVRMVTKMDKNTWIQCHVEAFNFFGGLVKHILLDNLKSGVLKPDLYDPLLNRAYDELGRHYGVLLDPCRSGSPKDKPRVERMIPYCRESLWKGREFTDNMDANNREALQWCLEVAGRRIHRTTRQRPVDLFKKEEEARLLPLPAHPFELANWKSNVSVGPDAHCSVDGHLYSVPWQLIGKKLSARITEKTVEFYQGDRLIKTHAKNSSRRRHTDPVDLPPDKVAYFQKTPQWCLKQANGIGEYAFEAVRQLLVEDTLAHLRSAQGIIRFTNKYGPSRVNSACQLALAYGDPSYRTIKGILERNQDFQAVLPINDYSGGKGAYLRGETAFAVLDERSN